MNERVKAIPTGERCAFLTRRGGVGKAWPVVGLAMLYLLAVTQAATAGTLSWRFTQGGWKPDEWILVKSPRMEHFGNWVQMEDHIQNEVPAGVSPEDMQGKRAPDTYTSMVYARPFAGDLSVSVNLAFSYRMAPLIVLAPELGRDAAGRPEYREHFEICVYNEGVNVWHHSFANGKPSYKKDAYAKFPLKPNTRYTLEVELKGKVMSVRIDGHAFGYADESLPTERYLGVTGCEGLNSFYDMTVAQAGGPAAHP